MPQLLADILGFLQIPLVQSIIWSVIFAAITLALANVAAHTAQRLLHHDSNPLPTSSIIVNIVRATVYVVGGSFILGTCFGQDVSAFITALGVGGIAVSLGFQDTLSNLIGGLQVTLMGIVKPGDNIEVGSSMGVVQDVTWRHTTIRDSLGQTVIIPNSVISKTALVHLLPASRVAVPFAVSRHVDVETLIPAGGHSSSEEAGPDPAENGRHGKVARDLDQLSDTIIDQARQAAGAVSPITDGPKVFFSEVSELGIKGKVIFTIEDASKTSVAADAVVRAIARELG